MVCADLGVLLSKLALQNGHHRLFGACKKTANHGVKVQVDGSISINNGKAFSAPSKICSCYKTALVSPTDSIEIPVVTARADPS